MSMNIEVIFGLDKDRWGLGNEQTIILDLDQLSPSSAQLTRSARGDGLKAHIPTTSLT